MNVYVFDGEKHHLENDKDFIFPNVENSHICIHHLSMAVFEKSGKHLRWNLTDRKVENTPVFEAYLDKEKSFIASPINPIYLVEYYTIYNGGIYTVYNSESAAEELLKD